MSDDFQSTPPAPTPPPPGPAVPPPAAGGDGPSDNGKLLAAFGYLVWVVALIALLMEPYKNERFVKHHAVQALALAVVGVAAGIISAIPYIGWVLGPIMYIAVAVFAIMGCIKAFGLEYWEMPVVYNIVKQYI